MVLLLEWVQQTLIGHILLIELFQSSIESLANVNCKLMGDSGVLVMPLAFSIAGLMRWEPCNMDLHIQNRTSAS